MKTNFKKVIRQIEIVGFILVLTVFIALSLMVK